MKSVYLILDNIRSAHNVGSIFRTADAAGVAKIYLCGITPKPSGEGELPVGGRAKMEKTSLGAEKMVAWEYAAQSWRILKKLKGESRRVIALELSPASKNIFKYKAKAGKPLVLVVGHERRGLSKKILEYVDDIVEIPMHGRKESLNVSVATGIALYQLLR
ncbi:MAG: hypothetical protein A2750_00545 [Candidatus Yanofskybacteria bacterium RIFCSPHIGHO2_01_FULL_45_42]|uniref:tRNA/rRNA methyltransferase SpoU type domain-containing protein n=3 Tax=Candidatus Yanofskyibacteriota TaxID=1752733 RepID=A0A1F8F567_9BACT|nr:MAG: hypothetical protein A2750_00545 [Candidatus Yanofskybacteria bacterium RIFCSPHIGHO2_01_FULL_45_42]OGN16389.1 MAG: hypothetical protein A3C81_02945 [Candidatus Yanofskybacteria bacterium RIFCSPHIGHO2_02_FULL_46_19]OGN27062.1 MAG: hypothetical protein A3B17_02435 [Candidatus Yanofskybacteria bacterium RIFCSPLOWO2_01_FULL_45_72]OGN32360.1 MAG: hypothetical protein A3J01_00335 [Candidatus Yanofskybacteria bacterium RIFCSPLOWO2_02_FULL_45_18]